MKIQMNINILNNVKGCFKIMFAQERKSKILDSSN